MRRIITKLSQFTKGMLLIAARAIGIEKTKNGYNVDRLVTAGCVFVTCIPFGILLLGVNMPIILWLVVVLVVLIAVNLDQAIVLASELTK